MYGEISQQQMDYPVIWKDVFKIYGFIPGGMTRTMQSSGTNNEPRRRAAGFGPA